MPQSKYFKFAVWLLVILLILLVASQLTFILEPIGVILTSLAAPLIISILFYYLLRPPVLLLCRFNVPKALAILIIYLIVIGLIVAIFVGIVPRLYSEFLSLINNMPHFVKQFSHQMYEIEKSPFLKKMGLNNVTLTNVANRFSKNMSQMTTSIVNNTLSIIQSVTGTMLLVVTIPFILFYLLKDGEGMARTLVRFIPEEHRERGRDILKDMDGALSGYIQGQMIVLLFDFVCILIWYSAIHLHYSLILALVILVTNVIPFIGSFIATVPAVIVAFIQDPVLAIYVIIGVIVVQQIEGNVVSPFVMGRKLDVHPLTIICILLVAGNLAGIIGMLLAIPFYAVCKVVVTRVYQLIQLRRHN
ncbi:MAG: AI-2E family transporter [Sporolactobacillus sp.]